MNQPISSPLRHADVITQLDLAHLLTERLGTEYPDNSYEEGVLDTLNWVLGLGAAPLDPELAIQPDALMEE